MCGKQFHVGAVGGAAWTASGPEVPGLADERWSGATLLRPDRSTLAGQDAFRFRHQLIRDAAYEAAPKALRAELHERFADWLEGVGEARVEEFEEILAYHLERAHRLLEELGPLDEAGRDLGLPAASALRGERPPSVGSERRPGRRDPVPARGRPPPRGSSGSTPRPVRRRACVGARPRPTFGVHCARRGRGGAAASGQRSIEWMARIDRGVVRMLIDPIGFTSDDLRAEVAAARAELEASGDDEALAIVWSGLVQVEWNPCRYDAAREAAIHAVDHARRSGDRSLLMDAMIVKLATELIGSTSPVEGRASFDAAVAELGREGAIGHVALVHEACLDAMTGDFDRARELIRESEAFAERFGSDLWVTASYEFGGEIELMAGDPEAAERSFRKEYEIHQRLGDEGHGSTVAAFLAFALCRLGRFDEADEFATIARTIGAEDDMATQAFARSAQALVRSAPRGARRGAPTRPGGRGPLRRCAEPLVPREYLADARGGFTRGRHS